jgi:hypothetical protein
MNPNLPESCAPHLTLHAQDRLRTRRIPFHAVQAVMDFGHCRFKRGAEVYLIGWREVQKAREAGVDLRRFEGVEVVCDHNSRVLTVYRNENSKALRLRKAA